MTDVLEAIVIDPGFDSQQWTKLFSCRGIDQSKKLNIGKDGKTKNSTSLFSDRALPLLFSKLRRCGILYEVKCHPQPTSILKIHFI